MALSLAMMALSNPATKSFFPIRAFRFIRRSPAGWARRRFLWTGREKQVQPDLEETYAKRSRPHTMLIFNSPNNRRNGIQPDAGFWRNLPASHEARSW